MKLGKVTIAAVGKLKKDHWAAAQRDYLNRLRRYTSISLEEVRDHYGKGTADSVALLKEGEALLDVSSACTYRIALVVDGELMDSLHFASTFRHWIEIYGNVAFLIGGPIGLSQDTISACHYQLSLSKLTLPHELARVLLLEQLYRAASIINKHTYHK